MPAIYHVKVVDDSFDGAVQHIIEAKPNDAVVWHCEEADANFDGAIFHVKWAAANFDGPVWRVLGIARSIVVVIGPAPSPLSLPDAIANSLSYVKAFGGTEQRNIPDNYIQRQFIYMMEGSYLLTDIVPTYDCKIEMDFQTTSVPSGSAYLLGGRTKTYGGLFVAKGGAGVCIVDAFGTESTDRYTSSVSLSNNTRYKFTFNNKVATLESGGTTLFTNTFTGTNANGAALIINGLNNNGAGNPGQAGIYLYSFRVWNGQGELVADYVPAVQKGTVPVVGFYDTVSKTFKTATAGTFAAGGEAVPTPEYPLDIVCNNGVLKYGFAYSSYNVARELSTTNYPAESQRSISYSDGVLTCTIDGSTVANRGIFPTWNLSFSANHKYGCVVRAKGTASINLGLASIDPSGGTTGGESTGTFYQLSNDFVWYANIWDCNTTSTAIMNIRVKGTTIGEYASFSDILVVDLTAIFGAGNEPTTPAKVLQRTVKTYTDGTVETIEDTIGNTATAEMLLKVGDYQDVQSIIDGVVTRNVGVKVLDGSEDWETTAQSTVYRWVSPVPFSLPNIGICSHYVGVSTNSTVADMPGMSMKTGSITASNIYIKDSSFGNNLAGFKQYLADQYNAGTPVIVVYPLKTPTTESVAGQTLQVTDGDNVLEITQASLNNLELEAEYQAAVSLTIQEVQDANLDPNVEVTIN